ncbi:unnamed protein product, partial [Vitis vinifera]
MDKAFAPPLPIITLDGLLTTTNTSREIQKFNYSIYGFINLCSRHVWIFLSFLKYLFIILINKRSNFQYFGFPRSKRTSSSSFLREYTNYIFFLSFYHLMWSDPEEIETWVISRRGAGWFFFFGSRVTSEFNHINNLDLVYRAHQLVQESLKYTF